MSNRILRSKIFAGSCLSIAFGSAGAADILGTLARVEGDAFISQGAQYVQARQGMTVNSGERLMVSANGSAIIDFADGCRFTVADGAVLNLGDNSPCASLNESSADEEVAGNTKPSVNGAQDSVLPEPASLESAVVPTTEAAADAQGISTAMVTGSATGNGAIPTSTGGRGAGGQAAGGGAIGGAAAAAAGGVAAVGAGAIAVAVDKSKDKEVLDLEEVLPSLSPR